MASILDGGPPGVCLFGLGEMLGAKLSISPTTDRLVSMKFCGGGGMIPKLGILWLCFFINKKNAQKAKSAHKGVCRTGI